MGQVALDKIIVPARLRAIDAAWVEVLASSFSERGQQEAILLRQKGDQTLLVAGAHRLEAARSLGWTEIEAKNCGEIDDDDARLAEIDENLIRRELSALDRAIFLSERAAIYERRYPDTRRGVAGGKARQNSATEMLSFADATAERTGFTARTIRNSLHLARNLDANARQALADTDVANNSAALKRIAALKPAQQVSVASDIANGTPFVNAMLPHQAAAPSPNPVQEQREALDKSWKRAGEAARLAFVEGLIADWKHSGRSLCWTGSD